MLRTVTDIFTSSSILCVFVVSIYGTYLRVKLKHFVNWHIVVCNYHVS